MTKCLFMALPLILFFSPMGLAIDSQRYDVDGLEVIHYIDESLPVYDAVLYLPQGYVVKDGERHQIDFDLLKHRMSSIAGMHQLKSFPEYSYFYFEGIADAFLNDVEKYCAQLSSQRPITQRELISYQRAASSDFDLESVQLAEDLFRFISFGKSKWGLARKVSDEVSKRTLERLDQIKKTLFIYGPRSLQKKLSQAHCLWGKGRTIFQLSAPLISADKKDPLIYIVDDSLNQVYWNMGKTLLADELPTADKAILYNEIVGHPQFGIWSQELRIDRGLVYQLETYFSIFANYGRVGLRSSTSLENSAIFLQRLLKSSESFSANTLSTRRRGLFVNFVEGHQAVIAAAGGDFLRQAVYRWHLSSNKNNLKSDSLDWFHYYRLNQWMGVAIGPGQALKSLRKITPIKTITLPQARRILSY